ncbi:MAG: sulfurtransferase-like selenium metabolism protein YedF [Clostridiales bacterium]|nr:sulfurtransferase-like selenium metabolism protein YedF [Clostridiales bacterium]
MTEEINAIGMACPLPVVETKKALEKAAEGDIICVRVDSESAVQNVMRLAEYQNLETASNKISDTEYVVRIRAGRRIESAAKTVQTESFCAQCPPSQGENMVLVISGRTMGSGEEELGKTLMKAFLFAQTKQDRLPHTVLLYNSGAYLSCEGSESLEDLRELEHRGVKILTCGTCLNHYGLTEKLGVGEITNMYSIVEIMEGADRLVRP